MKISSVNSFYNQNFSASFNTEDVLRVVTFYPYKGKGNSETIKALTGIEMYSDEFHKSLSPDCAYGCTVFAVESLCSQKILEQNAGLEQMDSSIEITKLPTKEGKKEADNWFKAQIKKLGKIIEVEPFTLTKEEIEEESREFLNLLNKIL